MSKSYHKTKSQTIRYHQIEEVTRVIDSGEAVRMKCSVTLGNGRKFHITVTGYWPVAECEYDCDPRWTFDTAGMKFHFGNRAFWFTEEYYSMSKIVGDELNVADWTIRNVFSRITDDIYHIRARWGKATGTYRVGRNLKPYKV